MRRLLKQQLPLSVAQAAALKGLRDGTNEHILSSNAQASSFWLELSVVCACHVPTCFAQPVHWTAAELAAWLGAGA